MMFTKRASTRRHVPAFDVSDRDMVAAVRLGDASIAQFLYDHLQPTIEYALSRVLRHRNGDLDDLVQVTFERVIRAIAADRFSGQSTLTTWTAAIASHVAIDYLRRLQVERRLFSDQLPLEPRIASSGIYWTERSLEARSEIQRLHAALSRMKPALAETVVLHDVLGHDVEEVATLTGASQAATRSRLFRGRKELLRQTGGRKAAS